MPGASDSIQKMVSTIVALKDLQFRQRAQDLAEKEFGLRQGMSQEEGTSMLQDVLQHSKNPEALLPFVNEFAGRSGLSPDLVTTLIKQTPPATATTVAGKVAAGAPSVDNNTTASVALTGKTPDALGAELEQNDLFKNLFGGANSFLNGMSPEDRKQFNASVLQKQATGESLRQAAEDSAYLGLPDAMKQQMIKIGAGLAPSAPQDAQIRLGWAQYRLDMYRDKSEAEARDMQKEIMLAEYRAKYGKDNPRVAQILTDIQKIQQEAESHGAEVSKFGTAVMRARYNSAVRELQQLAPDVYGPQGSVPFPVWTEGEKLVPSAFSMFMSHNAAGIK